jgi:hypothetical protein
VPLKKKAKKPKYQKKKNTKEDSGWQMKVGMEGLPITYF